MLLSCCLPLDGHLTTNCLPIQILTGCSCWPCTMLIRSWMFQRYETVAGRYVMETLTALCYWLSSDSSFLTGCSHIYCQSRLKCSRRYTCWLLLAQMCSGVCCCLCDLKNWVVCSLASQSCWSVSTSHISLSWVVSVEHTWPNNHNAFQFAAAEQLKVNGDRNWNDSSELAPIDTSCDSFVS